MSQSLPESRPKVCLVEAPQSNQETVYWPSLDGLRSLAFLLVFISHLMPLPASADPAQGWLNAAWNTFASWGWIGVELFFVLSAYLITTLLLREREKYRQIEFKAFFTRRVLRIWPLYYGFVLLAFFLIPMMNTPIAPPWGSELWSKSIVPCMGASVVFLFNFLLANAAPVMANFQRIHWSVAMEEQFYMVWGFIMSRVKSVKILFGCVPVGFIVTIATRWWIQNHAASHQVFYYNTLSHLDSILVGVLIALLLGANRLQPSQIQKRSGLLLVAPILFYLGLCLFAPPIYGNHPAYVILLTGIAAFCGVFVLAVLHGSLGQKLFSHPLLVRLGRLTYGMYLFHILGQAIAMFLTSQWAGTIRSDVDFYSAWLFYVVLSLLLTWLAAFLSWHLLEKRFYNLRYRFSRIPSGFGVGQ